MKIEECKVGDQVTWTGAAYTITAVGKKHCLVEGVAEMEFEALPEALIPVHKFQAGDFVKFWYDDRRYQVLYVGQEALLVKDSDGHEGSGFIKSATLIFGGGQ